MSTRNWLVRFVLLAAVCAALGGAVGCESTGGGGGSVGGDGHAGHSH